MNSIILSSLNSLEQFFEQHKIERAYVFGSAATDNFDENNDIDFLIKFKPALILLKEAGYGGIYTILYEIILNERSIS
jgi:predicted nucleotidyltransferase